MNQNKTILSLIALLMMVVFFVACAPPVLEVIDVTGVEIAEDDQSLEVGDTLQLTKVVTPEDAANKEVTWESDNTNVATVSENGLVTALSVGTANINVTTDDGAFTDTVKITVIVTETSPPGCIVCPPAVPKYTLTMDVFPSADGGTANDVTDSGPYAKEVELDILAESTEGWDFVNWTAPAGSFADAGDPDTTFIMPAEDVTVTANFVELFELTFIVRDSDDNLIEGAAVELDGVGTDTTGTDGEVVFEGLAPGTYDFTVTKDGYEDATGDVDIVDDDVTEDVTLLLPAYFEPSIEAPETSLVGQTYDIKWKIENTGEVPGIQTFIRRVTNLADVTNSTTLEPGEVWEFTGNYLPNTTGTRFLELETDNETATAQVEIVELGDVDSDNSSVLVTNTGSNENTFEATIRDENGFPITGLGKGDFELYMALPNSTSLHMRINLNDLNGYNEGSVLWTVENFSDDGGGIYAWTISTDMTANRYNVEFFADNVYIDIEAEINWN